jgi:hypothetical protein
LLIKKNNGVADQKNTFADHFTNSQILLASFSPSFKFKTSQGKITK